ncbi:MAG: hypothetical protein QM780_06440 [Hyphomicrobium sp.]|uniref:hypothetical protein n=1 Tax=Hyphomicrobium sp. TaxID=82 RepID=UPI0039E6467E
MQWMLVERKPDVVYVGRPDLYLGKNDTETPDADQALRFATREDAEAYRRKLAHRYDWVAIISPD